MTITMTNAQVYEAHNAVQILLNNGAIPLRGRLQLRSLARVLKGHFEDAEAERQVLLAELLEKDAEGKPQFIDGDQGRVKVKPEFPIKEAELMRIEVNGIPQVAASALGELEGVPGAILFGLHDALLDDLNDADNTTKEAAAGQRQRKRSKVR